MINLISMIRKSLNKMLKIKNYLNRVKKRFDRFISRIKFVRECVE